MESAMSKANEMKKPVVIRSTLDLGSKAILEQWAVLAGRSEQTHSGILLQRLIRLYEKNPQILVKLGLMSQTEHPELMAQLETLVA